MLKRTRHFSMYLRQNFWKVCVGCKLSRFIMFSFGKSRFPFLDWTEDAFCAWQYIYNGSFCVLGNICIYKIAAGDEHSACVLESGFPFQTSIQSGYILPNSIRICSLKANYALGVTEKMGGLAMEMMTTNMCPVQSKYWETERSVNACVAPGIRLQLRVSRTVFLFNAM